MSYTLKEDLGLRGKRAISFGHSTIESAVEAIPAKIVAWSLDEDHDAADAFAANGVIYNIEREDA